jgi:hyperosmotically inducible protein
VQTFSPRQLSSEELIMKSIIRNRTASGVLIASLAIASSAFSVQAFAQDASSPHATRSAARSANHKLERAVRKALDSAKVEASDIRIVARGGKVTLDGTVMDASQIDQATEAAKGVDGVSSVSNRLTVAVKGH